MTRDDQTWAVLAQLSTFSGYFVPFGNVLGPLLVWLYKKDESPYAAHHALEALNFQITVLLAMSVAGVLSIVLIGIPLLIGIAIADVVFRIIATIAANEGQWYRFPFTLRIVPEPTPASA